MSFRRKVCILSTVPLNVSSFVYSSENKYLTFYSPFFSTTTSLFTTLMNCFKPQQLFLRLEKACENLSVILKRQPFSQVNAFTFSVNYPTKDRFLLYCFRRDSYQIQIAILEFLLLLANSLILNISFFKLASSRSNQEILIKNFFWEGSNAWLFINLSSFSFSRYCSNCFVSLFINSECLLPTMPFIFRLLQRLQLLVCTFCQLT